ncbi:hypothetical protein CTRI78_v004368 [Colletotrichum trifolii]|uniref:BTB domain-containing protein n=1 Tax=Colletotrichum trifolii TaxID=5466 RepID=A0A4R8RLW7_COLTR|nr:hypothetical protein CTRI78_v004368 [Colletotrichum trifolii]
MAKTFEAQGDLVLLVGPTAAPYRVDSRALARVSPVFKAMLHGGFAEAVRPPDNGGGGGGGGSEWTVALPEDGRAETEILLALAHGSAKSVPHVVDLQTFYRLLTLTEKYDATHMVAGWACMWLLHGIDAGWGFEPEMLCLAWELGNIELFRATMESAIENSHVGPEGDVLYGRRSVVFTGTGTRPGAPTMVLESLEFLTPPDMFEIVEKSRQMLVRAELEPWIWLYQMLKQGKCQHSPASESSSEDMIEAEKTEENFQCDSMAFGSLLKSCSDLQLDMTNPDVIETYQGSVADLRLELSTVSVRFLSGHDSCCEEGKQHLEKGREYATQLRTRVLEIRKNHMRYLTSQAQKTGFPIVGDKRFAAMVGLTTRGAGIHSSRKR